MLIEQNLDSHKHLRDKKETTESDKIPFIGELSTSVIHEIRNPLTTLKGFMSLLETETTNKGKEYVGIMRSEIERIEKMANDYLHCSKPQTHQVQQQNIVALIQSVVFLLEPSAQNKQISIHSNFNDQPIHIKCDEVQIKQAIINIIKNAIEATPNHGEIIVDIKQKDHTVLILINDNGSGMSQEHLNQLGISFFTTKETGTGLGLMVTYNLIKNHGGQIDVSSKKGEGPSFLIQLPY
ncbi:ATP-binding protein [Pontibacillus marinus]|uniref:histidine kinase n=1 Tax=Pontibacillus marinus BH030004 = DSM 16465 TaxID=1385511 RepID=A0A0A5GDE7_9BACI|nr:ATP-binding protein [Pontibacillus marinus]KGX91246.1 histidine kinase [Pontibacillus marinus BH030004 = DSM 16465]